jgi:exopolysaccharide biosynthesis polyprenyl glycosylphosphotransferase
MTLLRQPTPVRVALDMAALVLATGMALYLRFGLDLFEIKEASPVTFRSHLIASAIWMGGVVVTFGLNRLYDEDTLFPGGGENARVVRSVVASGAFLSIFVFLTQSFYVSRSWFALSLALTTLLLVLDRRAFRLFLQRARRNGRLKRPAILVSLESRGWDEWPLESGSEFQIIAHVEPGAFEAFADNAREQRSLPRAAVILRSRDFTNDEFWRILMAAGNTNWSVFVHSPVRSVGRDRLTLRELSGHTIVKVAPPTLNGSRAVQKRALDLILSILLLVLLLPLMLLVVVIVLITSGWPILYRQERVGREGRRFRMLKFRTMKRDAERETGPTWAVADDPRRTPLGGLLRRTSLDELPQLLNVLLGHMSLVGPRPERPDFVDEFHESIQWYALRHRIKPGLTGWAQSHGLRGNTPLDKRVEHDNWYIENWSIPLDLKILARTSIEMIKGRGN